MANPFKPSAGSSPPELIGRESSLERIREAVHDGPGAPGRVSLFSGARGIGKTVMLNEVEDAYLAEGWLRVRLTATPSMLAQLLADVRRLVASQAPGAERRVTGVTAGWRRRGLGEHRRPGSGRPPERRRGAARPAGPRPRPARDDRRGARRGAQPAARGGGDSASTWSATTGSSPSPWRACPPSVSNLLSDHVLTFLRRADRHDLRGARGGRRRGRTAPHGRVQRASSRP